MLERAGQREGRCDLVLCSALGSSPLCQGAAGRSGVTGHESCPSATASALLLPGRSRVCAPCPAERGSLEGICLPTATPAHCARRSGNAGKRGQPFPRCLTRNRLPVSAGG